MIGRFYAAMLKLVAGAAASMPFLCHLAQAETRTGVDLSGQVQYSTNPFQRSTGNADAVRADISASPFVELKSARSDMRLTGTISHSRYSRIYNDSTDYGATFDLSRIVTSRMTFNAAASFSSSATGNYLPQIIGLTGAPEALPTPTDITLLGYSDRRTQLSASAGVNFTADARSSVALGYSGSVVRLPDAVPVLGVRQGEYKSIGQNFSYDRILTSRTTVGFSVGVSRVDYDNTQVGDSTIITPNLTTKWRLSGVWSVFGNAGVSIIRQQTVIGPQTSRSLALGLNACRSGPRTNFCFNGSRDATPSSLGAARETVSVGASYGYRLSARDTMTVNGNYVRSEDAFSSGLGNVDYLRGNLGFRRLFRSGLAIDVGGGFSTSRLVTNRSEARGTIGVTYLLGRRR